MQKAIKEDLQCILTTTEAAQPPAPVENENSDKAENQSEETIKYEIKPILA
jgi:hypothetical protein